MNRWIQNGIGLSAMGALCIAGWAAYQLGATVRENRTNIRVAAAGAKVALDPNGPDLPTIFNESRDVTIALLKPCKAGKPETCGLIPAVQRVASDTGAAVQTAGDQIKQTQPLIQSAALAVSSTSEHLNKTIDAATETTLQARVDLDTLNGSIGATKPLLEAYTRSGNDLNAILERRAIGQLLDNSAEITGSAAGIMADGKKVTDKATADYLSPAPWWKKLERYAGDTYEYGALFARHTP